MMTVAFNPDAIESALLTKLAADTTVILPARADGRRRFLVWCTPDRTAASGTTPFNWVLSSTSDLFRFTTWNITPQPYYYLNPPIDCGTGALTLTTIATPQPEPKNF